jgi:hypothetical protein
MQLASMKWTQVKDLCFSNLIALVPLGSIEQHRRHLPLSVDTDVITELAQRVERSGLTGLYCCRLSGWATLLTIGSLPASAWTSEPIWMSS